MKHLNIPQESKYDHVHKGIKALLNFIPVAGGTVTEIFDALVIPPIEKRRKEWMTEVVELLKLLESKNEGIVQSLSSNEEFITLLITTSIHAQKTHLSTKRKQLQSALISSIYSDLTFDIQQVYVNFVDQLTTLHIEILNAVYQFESELKGMNEYQEIKSLFSQNLSEKISEIPEMELTVFRFILKDLESKGLLYISSDMSEIKSQVYKSSFLILESADNVMDFSFIKITDFGNQFLKFIMSN